MCAISGLKLSKGFCRHTEMFCQRKGAGAKNGVGGLRWATPLIVDEMEDDNVDIDSRYTNDHGLNSSCHEPWLMALQPSPQLMASQRPYPEFQLPVTLLSASQVTSASPLTHARALAFISNQHLPALTIHDRSMPADVNPKSTSLTSTSRPQGTVSPCFMQCTLNVALQSLHLFTPVCSSGNSVDVTGDHLQHSGNSRVRTAAHLPTLQAAPASLVCISNCKKSTAGLLGMSSAVTA